MKEVSYHIKANFIIAFGTKTTSREGLSFHPKKKQGFYVCGSAESLVHIFSKIIYYYYMSITNYLMTGIEARELDDNWFQRDGATFDKLH